MIRRLPLYLICLFLSSFSLFSSKDKTTAKVAQEQVQPAPAPEVEETKPVPPSYEGTFFKMILTLLGLIILIFLTFWTIRRLSQGRFRQMNSGRSIKILERRPLSAKSVLYLIEVGTKRVVVAESQLEIKAIADIENIPQ
jgi:flagellar biogenesis protein FliO